MNITAMLCWFDEPEELLRQAVRSAAVICDRIVAADGAFKLAPDAKPQSDTPQKHAIRKEAAKQGLELDWLVPQIWEGQVAKRDAVLQRAKEGSDWVMTLDADWKITGDRAAIRDELEQMHANGYQQVAVDFVTPDDPSRSWDEKAANHWHVEQAGKFEQLPLIYRVLPKMEYRKNHWSIYCIDEAGDPLGLFGANNFGSCGLAKTGYLSANHLFEHLCLFREQKQIQRNREYISVRDEAALTLGYET